MRFIDLLSHPEFLKIFTSVGCGLRIFSRSQKFRVGEFQFFLGKNSQQGMDRPGKGMIIDACTQCVGQIRVRASSFASTLSGTLSIVIAIQLGIC